MQSEQNAILTLIYNDLNDHNRQEPIFGDPYKLKQICSAHPCLAPYLMKLIAETRDYTTGKGEKKHTQELLQQWAEIDENEAAELASHIADHYGCWKDVKTLCLTAPNKPAFVKRLIREFNERIEQEHMSPTLTPTNVAKWAPREKSKTFGSIYDQFAIDWCLRTQPHLLQEINPRSLNKCRQQYREVISGLHRKRPSPVLSLAAPVPTEAEIIHRATTAASPEEEATIDQLWLQQMEQWPIIDNLIPVAVYGPNPDENPPLTTLLRLIYRSSLKKRFIICIDGQATWVNAENANLSEIIWQIPAQTVAAEPTEVCTAINLLSNGIRQTNTPPIIVEKLTLAIIGSMDTHSGEPKTILHNQILTCFFHHLGCVKTPHIAYFHTTQKRFFTTQPQLFQPLPVLAETPRATFFPTAAGGPTPQQWAHLVAVGCNTVVRHFSPIQAIKTLLDTRPCPHPHSHCQNPQQYL